MDKPSFKLVGAPCGQHGQYTFYKALKVTTGEKDKVIAIGDFFFVRIWQDSELVSIGELQLLWTDRVSDQTLVSLRLYFLPENTPEGRGLHGQDEVQCINEKVVLRADDLLSWMCDGTGWRWGLKAVWRGACAPQTEDTTQALHASKMDLSDINSERTAAVDEDGVDVVVFSYPRYCRYRALLARLEGIQADWLRDSLVAALGGYAAPTKNTRILYCKDTFEYPELEGHEFVVNHLAPRARARPRGRRRRRARSLGADSRSRSRSRSSDSDTARQQPPPQTPRRLSLRNGSEKAADDESKKTRVRDSEKTSENVEDEQFVSQLRGFYKKTNDAVKVSDTLKDLSLRVLYGSVKSHGGYNAVCRNKLWRNIHVDHPARTRRHYERFLLPFENHERKSTKKHNQILNGKPSGSFNKPVIIKTIDICDSPPPPADTKYNSQSINLSITKIPQKNIKLDNETGEMIKEEYTNKPAEELNREFLDSLPKNVEKSLKISVKPVEKLIEPSLAEKSLDLGKILEENNSMITDMLVKYDLKDYTKLMCEIGSKQLSGNSTMFLKELSQRLNLTADNPLMSTLSQLPFALSGNLPKPAGVDLAQNDKPVNGHHDASIQQAHKPIGSHRSSLRAVRVKPGRPNRTSPPTNPASSSSSSPIQLSTGSGQIPPTSMVATQPPITNFGIHHPPKQHPKNDDDDIVEVPYKPKTPEIIDLDEYPESPQSLKKKKLDILKERGLEVTAIPTVPSWPSSIQSSVLPNAIAPLLNPASMLINPAVQHQIMTQAQLFQMYNIIPPNFPNGTQQPPKILQSISPFGNAGREKTVYGNPKDPFMPPPHILQGAPIKQQRQAPVEHKSSGMSTPQDILDLTCKSQSSPTPNQKPDIEIVRIPTAPSPSKTNSQNAGKNYTLIDGKAVVGSNLEITLVSPKQLTPPKNRSQKRSSNGQFMAKTPTPPKDYPRSYSSPSPSNLHKKSPIVVPNYQMNSTRDEASPTSSTGSTNSQTNYLQNNLLQNVMKNQNSLAQIMEMQKNSMPSISPFVDPMYMGAFYNSIAGQMDQRQLAMYRELMTNHFRNYTGLLNMGAVSNTPTTKN